MPEEIDIGDGTFEISYNERSRNDMVYIYLEQDAEFGIFEGYISKESFERMTKAMLRLDERIKLGD